MARRFCGHRLLAPNCNECDLDREREELALEVRRLRAECPRCGLTNAECEHRGGHVDSRDTVRTDTRRLT